MRRALLRGLVRGLILLALIGGAWFLYRSSTRSASDHAAGENLVVSAEQLASAYEADPAQADALYQGKQLSVGGTIRAIERGPVVKLAGNTPYSTVWAQLEASQADAVARLGKDAHVNLGCKGGGMSQRMPLLHDCVVLP